MKKTFKRIVCLALVVAFVGSLAGCAKINYITNGTIGAIQEVKSGEWKNTGDETSTEITDEIVIDELTPGTYGGVEFKDNNDVADYYVKCYDYTKTLLADYITEDGSVAQYYKLLGEESLSVHNVLVDGKENSTINSIVEGIVPNLFAPGCYGLVPCCNRDPNLDNNSEDAIKNTDHDFRTSGLTGDDVLASNVVDNNDGTITLTIQPKMGEMSYRGDDSQGKFFEVLGDIGATVESISVLSFSDGTAKDNVKVYYVGGTGTVTIDTKTGEITGADYNMEAKVFVTHANVAIIKDKSASVEITYKNHYPASAEYLMSSKKIKAK